LQEEVVGLPNIKSAKKRVEVNEKRNMRNRMRKTNLKTTIKKVDAAVEGGDRAAAVESYAQAAKKIDQAVVKGILHKNTAARRKSRLARAINSMA
jgi:small subunit ribosomal protein S20